MRVRAERLSRLSVVAGRAATKVLCSIPALAGVLLLSAGPARAEATAEVRLLLDGRDVTKQHQEAVIRLMPRPRIGSHEIPPEVQCSAGQVCNVPPGLYYLEVEDPELIVEIRPKLVVQDGDDGAIPISVPVTRAAVLTVPDGQIPLGGSLEAIDVRYGVLHARRVDGKVARVRVPGRRVILCGYDEGKRPIGCRGVAVRAGETVSLETFPRPGRGRGQLLVGLSYPDESAPADAQVSLRVADRSLPPDDVVTGRSQRLYAVWYDVPAGKAGLELSSKFWFLREPAIEIPERGTKVAVGIAILRKPKITVSLEGAERLGSGEIEMELFPRCTEGIASLDAPPPLQFCGAPDSRALAFDTTTTFPDLDPGLLAIRWRKAGLSSARWVDLRDGESRDLRLPVEISEVHGIVRRNGRPLAAEMRWEIGNGVASLQTRTGPDGDYRFLVAQSGDWGVGLRDEAGRVFAESCAVRSDTQCDFDVPANRLRVRVTDESDAAVQKAAVSYRVRDPAGGGEPRELGGETTDSEGVAELPPLRSGLLSVDVRAEGFAPGRANPVEVTAETLEREVAVVLRRGAGIRISVIAPDGTPARQARVRSGAYGAVADESGIARFEAPLSPGSPLVVFDLRGEMAFSRFSGEESSEVRIPRSGPPIRLRLQEPDGKPLPNVGVHVAVDGILDDSRFLDQILWSGGQWASNESGEMLLTGLPGQGSLTVYPAGRPDLALTRVLPVTETLVFSFAPALR